MRDQARTGNEIGTWCNVGNKVGVHLSAGGGCRNRRVGAPWLGDSPSVRFPPLTPRAHFPFSADSNGKRHDRGIVFLVMDRKGAAPTSANERRRFPEMVRALPGRSGHSAKSVEAPLTRLRNSSRSWPIGRPW